MIMCWDVKINWRRTNMAEEQENLNVTLKLVEQLVGWIKSSLIRWKSHGVIFVFVEWYGLGKEIAVQSWKLWCNFCSVHEAYSASWYSLYILTLYIVTLTPTNFNKISHLFHRGLIRSIRLDITTLIPCVVYFILILIALFNWFVYLNIVVGM